MTTNDIELDYNYLTQQALRGVIRDVLHITSELNDVPGEHHFYIEFQTRAPGVEVSEDLLATYPERMTIVLQHKFENLVVGEDHFEVTLHFQGEADRLVIPYAAITNFVDPSCDFALHFEMDDIEIEELPEESEAQEAPAAADTDENDAEEGSADVVSLDSFRKK